MLLGVWFTFAVSAAAMGMFKNVSDSLALPVAVAALAPIAVFLSWFTASAGFRQYLYGLNPRTLTLAQAWRVNGVVFLFLSAYGFCRFLFATCRLGRHGDRIDRTVDREQVRQIRAQERVYSLGNPGIADLVMAVTIGTTVRLIDQSGPGMGPMAVLPLSLGPDVLRAPVAHYPCCFDCSGAEMAGP